MNRTDYIKTLSLVALVIFATTQRTSGLAFLLFLPLFILSVIYTSFSMLRRPDERKKHSLRFAIWFATFALAGTVQTY
jgi:uncharacterized protein (DUF58 family)